jgi:hypothetical protein
LREKQNDPTLVQVAAVCSCHVCGVQGYGQNLAMTLGPAGWCRTAAAAAAAPMCDSKYVYVYYHAVFEM